MSDFAMIGQAVGMVFTVTNIAMIFFGLVLGMVIAGMLIFQFPLVVYALLTLGVVSLDAMRRGRKWIIVIILIVAGILTPPDVASQVLMALPCYLLFEAALWIYSMRRRNIDA